MKLKARSHLNPGEHGYEIRGGTVEKKVLTLGATDSYDTVVGGVKFTDCEFRMKRVKETDFNFDATCVDCDFHLPKRVSNRYMDRPVLDSCRFHGHFVGFDFGPKFLNGVLLGPSPGRLHNCDFSDARLHLCAFYETSLAAHSWPDWPHIYLDYSEDFAWAHSLAKTPVPKRLKTILTLQSNDIDIPEVTRVRSQCIVSVYLPDLEEDPEALWPLIQDVPQIWFPGKSKKGRATPEQVSAAEQKNVVAATKEAVKRDRLSPFWLIQRCWLLECRTVEDTSGIELVFDSSYLQKRVPEAPPKVRLFLTEGEAILRGSSGHESIDGSVEKFMVTGTDLEGNTVILKPHRKERGQVAIDFSDCVARDEIGNPLEISQLRDFVNRYWRPD
ncbi:hypothetical protein ACSFA7_32630 [Variovorax sp. LT1R20]|uniref:hypothetical protein n=1 Tax=Variovorax sp. LT1R20 TaxID=3443729 RepID=UPI003F477E90